MGGAGLQKAKIKVYREPPQEIFCLFNPAEYKISESAGYSDKNKLGKSDTAKQFTGGYRSSLSLTLHYDLTENLGELSQEDKDSRSVRADTDRIAGLLKVEGSLHKPPVIEFIWGDLSYKGVLTALNQEFSYFGIEGNPLRAKLDLTISAQTEGSDQASPPESPDRTKHRRVVEGTALWRLAWEEYGDCEKWREIARYNGLAHPLDIQPGQVLRLPALKG